MADAGSPRQAAALPLSKGYPMGKKKLLSLGKAGLPYIYIFMLGILFALSYVLFVVPNSFAPSGLSGIAIMIQYKAGFSVAYMYFLINLPLCVFAFFAINRNFACKTMLFCVAYSGSYLLFEKLGLEQFQYNAGGVDTIYPVLIAGLISGFCYGTTFRMNGSTGGTDVVSRYVSQARPMLSFFWVTFAINVVVATTSYFVYATPDPVTGEMIYNLKPVCLCLLYSFISSFTGSLILRGHKQARKFIIITNHAEEVERDILEHLHHSATRIVGYGCYTHQERDVMICIVNKHQLVDFENILKKYPDTFAFVETVDETIGNFSQTRQRLP